MNLSKTPDLFHFLSTYFPDADSEKDIETTQAFAGTSSAEKIALVISQAKAVLEEGGLPVDEFGSEANRWFAGEDEAREWLMTLVKTLEEASGLGGEVVVKDSNGAVLSEGDSVQVIKDLKVKGGSSDLKRGTLIKKIHLIGDAGNIECRVDGSTLVLKTVFLKKV